jgi:hypothetical protein
MCKLGGRHQKETARNSVPSFWALTLLGGTELSFSAVQAVEQQALIGSVVDPVRLPALIVRRQPDLAAFLALRDEGDLLRVHSAESKERMRVDAWEKFLRENS